MGDMKLNARALVVIGAILMALVLVGLVYSRIGAAEEHPLPAAVWEPSGAPVSHGIS